MAGFTNVILTVKRNVNLRKAVGLGAEILKTLSPGTYELQIVGSPVEQDNYVWAEFYDRYGNFFGVMALGSTSDPQYFASYTVDTTEPDVVEVPAEPEWYENFLRTQVELAEGLIQGLEILSHFVGLYRAYYVELITDIEEE